MIRVEGFWKFYDGGSVLKDISLAVAAGETVALVGPSGCGKTTLLRHIAGLENNRTGEVHGAITLRDRFRILSMSERAIRREGLRGRQVGLVFQHSALFDSLSVLENLRWGLEENEKKLRPSEVRARVQDVVRMTELPPEDGFLSRPAGRLSGGERKRVALARALILRPSILLYDEPTMGLDPPTAAEIVRLIRRLAKEGTRASLIATHDMATVRALADRVVMVRGGIRIFEGTLAAAEADPEVRRFLETTLFSGAV